ncbi:MAG: hypothetical protein AB1938_24565 [Myxococcota bacterium]
MNPTSAGLLAAAGLFALWLFAQTEGAHASPFTLRHHPPKSALQKAERPPPSAQCQPPSAQPEKFAVQP